GGQEDTRTVEIEVLAVDPELAKAEADGMVGVEPFADRLARLVFRICQSERNNDVPHVLGSVDVPEFLRLPAENSGDAAVFQIIGSEAHEGATRADYSIGLADVGLVWDLEFQDVGHICREALESGTYGGNALANRSIHLHIGDARPRG